MLLLLILVLLLSLLSNLLLLPHLGTKSPFNLPRSLQIQPRTYKHNPKVEKDIRPEDTIIPPHKPPVNIKRSRKRIAISVLAEATQTIGLSDDIALRLLGVGASIGIAGLAGRCWEAGEFLGVAADGEAVGYEGEEAF